MDCPSANGVLLSRASWINTTVDGSVRPAWWALVSSSISALETFRAFSCGTLSSHMAIWLACSVSGFLAGLHAQASRIAASNNPQGRRRSTWQRHGRREGIIQLYPSREAAELACASKINGVGSIDLSLSGFG